LKVSLEIGFLIDMADDLEKGQKRKTSEDVSDFGVNCGVKKATKLIGNCFLE
jgi:hypothetical protein